MDGSADEIVERISFPAEPSTAGLSSSAAGVPPVVLELMDLVAVGLLDVADEVGGVAGISIVGPWAGGEGGFSSAIWPRCQPTGITFPLGATGGVPGLPGFVSPATRAAAGASRLSVTFAFLR